MNEGYIKFNCRWIESDPCPFAGFKELNGWREQLYRLGLIGSYPNEVGYGNISIRADNSGQFYISGSKTGVLERLNEAHYTLVTDFNFETNSLTCQGPVIASSESLTHAAVYQAAPEVNAVVHVHHLISWENLLNNVPTTSPDVTYGTPEMALEIFRLFEETDLKDERILAMAGHQEGIVAFGRDLDEAARVLLDKIRL